MKSLPGTLLLPAITPLWCYFTNVLQGVSKVIHMVRCSYITPSPTTKNQIQSYVPIPTQKIPFSQQDPTVVFSLNSVAPFHFHLYVAISTIHVATVVERSPANFYFFIF
jgi:hypothetical protein